MARRTAEELQLHHNRESHDGKGTTVRGLKGLHIYTASNEMDVVPIGATTLKTQGLEVEPATEKLKEDATRPIAVPPASTTPRNGPTPDSEAAN